MCGCHGVSTPEEAGGGMATGTKRKPWIVKGQGKEWKIREHQASRLESFRL